MENSQAFGIGSWGPIGTQIALIMDGSNLIRDFVNLKKLTKYMITLYQIKVLYPNIKLSIAKRKNEIVKFI
jgi:hypothetical protein